MDVDVAPPCPGVVPIEPLGAALAAARRDPVAAVA
jgi:hypothetical protein